MSKHIHIVGIAGVATSGIAIALRNASWKVTGSDKGFFPPVSTVLKDAKISFYAGWHPEKMIEEGMPDVVMLGGAGKSSLNPEIVYAKKNNIPVLSYPQILENYFIREHSVVCAGTWGKTSSTALLSFIFEEAGLLPSYMFGAISLSQKESATMRESEWSVLEGDEYTGSQEDNIAKFFHYHPTHLLLTSVSWDHADVYPTATSYFEAFEKLLMSLPPKNLIIANGDDPGVKAVLQNTRKAAITYGVHADVSYRYENVTQTTDGISFDIIDPSQKKHRIVSSMLGSFQAENLTGCFAMAHTIGIPRETIVESIREFKGIKRRMEKRYDGNVTIIDDIAHSPQKVTPILKTLNDLYKGKLFAIFEPNSGGRKKEAKEKYTNAFFHADEVIIPRLSPVKIRKGEMPALDGKEIVNMISNSHKNVKYIEDDTALIEHLRNTARHGDCIVFLGSHSFREMIPEIIKILSTPTIDNSINK